MKLLKNILLWTLVAFMALVALAFFPSIASIIAIIFAVIAAPIKPLQEFFANRGLCGLAKGAVLCAAFIGTMATVPARPTSTAGNTTRGTLPSATVTQEAANPGKSAKPTQTPGPSTKPTPTPEPAVAPTSEPTPAPAPDPADSPSVGNTSPAHENSGEISGGSGNGNNFNTWDNPDQQQTSQSWVLNTSTMKIHYPHCSSVANIAPHNYSTSNASLTDLLNRGYSRCGRCF